MSPNPTAVCGKPHVRWCGRAYGRNPISSTRSPSSRGSDHGIQMKFTVYNWIPAFAGKTTKSTKNLVVTQSGKPVSRKCNERRDWIPVFTGMTANAISNLKMVLRRNILSKLDTYEHKQYLITVKNKNRQKILRHIK